MSETVAKQYMGTLGAMSKSMGFSEQASYDMAEAVTGLTGDVASFYNLSTDEAFDKLKSIWTGETETLKSIGVLLTQTNLDQYALNNGFENYCQHDRTGKGHAALSVCYVIPGRCVRRLCQDVRELG